MQTLKNSLNPVDMGKMLNPFDCYRSLWAAMMLQMIEDFKSKKTRTWYSIAHTTGRDYEIAKFWLESNSTHEPGSFLAVCDTLELDPAIVRKELFKK